MNHEQYQHMHGHSQTSMKKVSLEVSLKDKKHIAEWTMSFVFALIAVAILHVTFANFLSRISSLKSPTFYIVIGAMLVVLRVKIKHLLFFTRKKKR